MAFSIKDIRGPVDKIGSQILPLEKDILQAQQQIAPGQLDLVSQLLRQAQGRGNIIDQGQQIRGDDRFDSAQNDLNLLQGVGGERALAARDLLDRLSPEQAALRQQAGQSSVDLLRSLDPNKLSGSELADTERFVNRSNVQSGVADSGSNSAAIRNALQFSDRLQARRAQLSQALGTVMPQINNLSSQSFNAGNTLPGFNMGTAQFQGIQSAPVGTQTIGLGHTVLGGKGNAPKAAGFNWQNAAGGAVAGGVSGAAAGSAFPGPGTIIGGGIGAILGGVAGGLGN